MGNANMYKQIRKIVIMCVTLSVALPAAAQDDEATSDDVGDLSQSCVSTRSIRRTEVLDDLNILFYMNGKVVLHNILPRQCNGLAREDRFSYKTSIGRLCNNDMIRVLHSDPFSPYGLREGVGCRLGKFHKITREDAAALKDPAPAPQAGPLPMPEPQEVSADEVESAEPELR